MFPNAMPCEITVHLKNGKSVAKRVDDYEGFLTRPMSLTSATEKFTSLVSGFIDEERRKQIIDIVAHLENVEASQLTEKLDFSKDSEHLK